MDFFADIHFLDKQYFYMFFLLPVIIFYYYFSNKKNSKKIVFLEDMQKIYWKINYFFIWKIILITLIFSVFIIILANPNKINVSENIKKNWIDIVFALDISKSMEAEDLKPTRIEAAKNILQSFIKNLKTDRVWLVVFAWKPLTSIPLTFDYNILDETLWNLTTDSLNQNVRWLNWTAVWDALLISKKLFLKQLFHPPTPSLKPKGKGEDEKEKNREKVIILLTDWDSNRWINPVLVAKLLKKEKIKIYTIWIGSKKWWIIKFKVWPFVQTQTIPPLNEETLKEISKISNWEFFRAVDNKSFEKIFEILSKLAKNDIEVKIIKNTKEYYKIFWIILVILIFLLFLLENRKN